MAHIFGVKEDIIKEAFGMDDFDKNHDVEAEKNEGKTEDEVTTDNSDIFETPKLIYLKKKEEFLQRMLFADNWGLKGSKKRVIAADTIVKYLEDVKAIVDKYPGHLNSSLSENVDLIFTRVLPIPADMVTYERLAEIAFAGKRDPEEQFERLLNGFKFMRYSALDFHEFCEHDRVHFFEDYRPDRPPRARHGFWSWNKEQWMIKDNSIIEEE